MKWKLQKPDKFKVSLYQKVFEDIGLSQTMARILINRNVDMRTALKLLKNPTELFEEPIKIYGAELVAKEILKYLNQDKRFYVYADYDVDGMTSGYIVTEYLRSLGETVEVTFPERSDGYGINLKFCTKVAEDKNAVVITVDNGITKVDEVKFLNENKIPVIVTDHHQPAENLPECPFCDAFADKGSAGKHLCGAGIIWKVICLVDEFLKSENYSFSAKYAPPEKFIPYVAIGTIGDMMPLTAENLAIIKIGMEMIRQHKVKTLDVLFKSGLFGSSEVNVRNIAFGLNSMMNACSRMGDINKACKLFFLENASEDEIYAYGQEMKKMNVLMNHIITIFY